MTGWSHHVLGVRMSEVAWDVRHALITLSHDPIVTLKTLVRVCNPIIVLSLVLHEVLLLIIINSV